MSVYHLLFDRGLQQLARSFLEQLFEKRLLFIFKLAYQARSLYSLALAHPFFLASSGEAAGFLFVTERSPRSRKRCRQDACRVDRNLILVLAFHRLPVSRYSVSVMRGDAPYGLPVDSV
jgi:hypothetical protein